MNEELQKKYIEMQLLEQYAKQTQQQLIVLNQQLQELSILSEALEEFSKCKENSKMFSPIGSGIFVEAELKNTKKVLVNVGARVATYKTIDEAKGIVNKQVVEITQVINKLEADFMHLINQAAEIKENIKDLSKKEK